MFTSNYNPSKLIFMMTKTLIWNFLIFFVQPVFMSLYLFLPPLPRLSYHFIPTFFCSKTFKQCFLWIKYTNAKDMPYPLGPKQVLNTLLQRKSTRSAFAEKECLCDVSPTSGRSMQWEKKIFHGGSFLKLGDDNKYIKNPEAQNRALRGFWENAFFVFFTL